MNKHIFTGFGFGPIQSGLFAAEAFKSGNFKRIVIAEIDQKLIDAIRANNGSYWVNVASSNGVTTERIDGIEIYNPTIDADRSELLKALSQTTEIVTSLPSVKFFDAGEHSVASLIAQGLQNSTAPATIFYAAENDNHAAEILEEAVTQKIGNLKNTVQFLNTVIGKMSQVVINPEEIAEKNLKSITPNIGRAFLVEEFNKILVTKCEIPEFQSGIEVFFEKKDLLPFEEAKLFGHNAIHTLLAYLGAAKGYSKMAELENDKDIMQIARAAFIDESGAALIQKYANLDDELFTPAGFRAYAEDLLERMTNPYLDDPVERAARDPQRKLGRHDRIFGTMKLALEYGIEPVNMAKAAVAAIMYYRGKPIAAEAVESTLTKLWQPDNSPYKSRIIQLVKKAIGTIESGNSRRLVPFREA